MDHTTRRSFLKRTAAAAGFGATFAVAGSKVTRALAGAKKEIPMKYSICNETFGDWPQEKIFQFAAQCGYGGVEFAPFTVKNNVTEISSGTRADLRKQADKANVEIVGLHWLLAKTEGLHLTSPDPQVRRKTTDYLGELAKLCHDLGGKVMVFGSPKQRNLLPGVARDQGMQYAEEVLRGAMPLLQKLDVVLALEALAPKETNFLKRAADAVELVERVDSPQCRMMLDCKASSSESTPIAELIRRHGSRLAHFHANDPNLQGPGFGELDFVPILQALRDVDYRGWVSVEVFDYSPGPERLARESIEYLKQCAAKLDG